MKINIMRTQRNERFQRELSMEYQKLWIIIFWFGISSSWIWKKGYDFNRLKNIEQKAKNWAICLRLFVITFRLWTSRYTVSVDVFTGIVGADISENTSLKPNWKWIFIEFIHQLNLPITNYRVIFCFSWYNTMIFLSSPTTSNTNYNNLIRCSEPMESDIEPRRRCTIQWSFSDNKIDMKSRPWPFSGGCTNRRFL